MCVCVCVCVCVCLCGVSLVIEINSAEVEVGNNGLFLSIVQYTESYTCMHLVVNSEHCCCYYPMTSPHGNV